jgi:UDP-N-acetylglucosamine acyltransferase
MSSIIPKDIPPYIMVSGHMAQPHGLNSEGLKRHGFSAELIKQLKESYKILYRSGLRVEEAIIELQNLSPLDGKKQAKELLTFIDFLQNNVRRGIIR